MKKQILFAFIFLFTTFITHAQGPYTSTDFGVVGDSLFYTSVNVDTSTLNFAQAGTNITWNFASLAPTTQFDFDFLNPLTAGYRAAFLTECTAGGSSLAHCNTEFNALTNVAFRNIANVNIQGQVFTNIINNDLKSTGSLEENILGLTTKISGVNVPFTATYSSPDVLYVFPINYGNRDTSVSSYDIDLTAHGLNFVYKAHSVRANYADAYGTITTPHATYTSTVRHRSYVHHTDTLFYDGAVIPIAPSTSFEYDWFDASFTGPVFTASGTLAGNQEKFTNVTYLDTIHCLAPRADEHHNPAPGVIDPSVGYVAVNFTNTSTNANTYSWNFDDPASGILNSSTAIDPTHIYDSAGTYTIELIACNTACNPEQCDTGFFTVNVIDSGALRASFIVTPAVACIEDTVKFTNTSTNATGYLWNFGDQNTSTTKSPKHIYTLPGTYTVTLIVTNGVTSDTTTRTVTVNAPPDAQVIATGPTTFCNGDSVTLSASGGTVYHWSNGHVGQTLKVKTSGTFTVTVTNSCGSSTSTPITVTVNTPVDTIIALSDTNFCSGDSVQLSVNTANGATYQWKRNGQVIAGATTTTYYAKTTGNYIANVFLDQCEGVSNTIHVTANATPRATISTTSGTTFCSGDSIKLTEVVTTGATYQWQVNGANISGATAHTYYAKDSGSVTAVVTDNGCSATSNSILVDVTATPNPAVTAQGSTTTCAGDSVNLSTVIGLNYTYQWYNSNNIITGATLPSYSAVANGSYTVIATNAGCAGTSNAVSVTVNPAPTANAGTPTSIQGCQFSNNASLGGSPTASGGTGPYTYKWTPTSGLNDSVISNPTVSGIGSTTVYTVVVTDNSGCSASSSVTITVTGSSLNVSIAPTGDTTWCVGTNGSVTLTATATGGGTDVYNWTPSTGLSTTTAATTVASPTAVGVYSYQVLVTNGGGCQASSTITVTVEAPPVVTITALDTTVPCTGDTVNFVATSGYTYQWLNSGSPVNGANDITYGTTDAGTYSVSATAGVCSATSNTITVTLRPNPTASILVHGGTAICEGGSTLLLASSANGYSYQWYSDDYGIAGATSASYNATDSGTYTAIVTLNGCSETSNSITITEAPYPVDTIVAEGPTSFCAGDNVVLSASTGAGYAYQWLNNGNYISNATDSVLTVSGTGTYSALIELGSCASTSTGIQVTVYPYPIANLTNTGNLTFCGGDSVTLNATDSSDYNYIWFVTVGGETDTLPNVTPNITVGDSGAYYFVATDNSCASTSNSLYANELPLPNATAYFNSGDGYVCPGNTVNISAGNWDGYTYQWQKDGANISGATSTSYAATDSGVYTVVVTGGGCTAVSNFAIVSYDSCATGIPTIIDNQSIVISPNPAHNIAILSLTCNQSGNISIKLYDLLGKQVATIFEGKTFAGDNMYSIPMDNLAQGMYMIKIYDGSSIKANKLMKE